MTNAEKMEKGLIYDPVDSAILKRQVSTWRYIKLYNNTSPTNLPKLRRILKKCLGSMGNNVYITPPFYANWAGKHVYIGDNLYANFNLTLVDDGNIFIGNSVMIGPNVTITSAGHPVKPELRKKGLQFNDDVHIGNNVWIGANVAILPGVTVGDNSVIGAGSVVTRSIPANVVAVGNPCRVMREIGEKDNYFKGKLITDDDLSVTE